MARSGIYKSEVIRARDKLLAMGRHPQSMQYGKNLAIRARKPRSTGTSKRSKKRRGRLQAAAWQSARRSRIWWGGWPPG